MNRLHPFDQVFGGLTHELDALRTGADQAGLDLRSSVEFAKVPEVQRLLSILESPTLIANDPRAAAEYLSLLFVAYRFWDAGAEVCPAPREALEPALDADLPTTPLRVPHGACYVQLPLHWVWAQVSPDAPHEPMDGMFVTVSPRGDQLTIVAVLGIRAERSGFSQISLAVHPSEVAAARDQIRPDRFAPLMEGGAPAGFRSVASAAELLVLTQLALEHVAR
ncbi:MAG: hypothetical protein IH965_01975 [Gemmatimonadetes bacterium]|nr:hypothetical protein [Gemmatimonadota bacterium]